MAQWRNYINGKKPKTIPIASKAENVVHPALDSAAHNAEMKSRPKEPSTDLLKSIPSVRLLPYFSSSSDPLGRIYSLPSYRISPNGFQNDLTRLQPLSYHAEQPIKQPFQTLPLNRALSYPT